MAGDDKKVSVNGVTSGYNPSTQDQITMAMVQNGGVKRIQQNLRQRLDEAGWSQNLRDYLELLFRSGEATTYDEALKLATKHISLQSLGEEPRSTVNGVANGTAVPDLVLPRLAVKDSSDFVRKELAKIIQPEEKK